MDKQKQFGKFKLIKKIASGGMGEIFLAKHVDYPESQKPFALKRILPSYAKDKRFIRVFFREAKIIAGLDHKNLLKVRDFGKEQDSFYMTMDFIQGVSIEEILSAAKENPEKWSPACGIEIIRQALAGIGSAHRQKDKDGNKLDIVHLDLNPRNLMVSTEGLVKILDFGVSKAIYEDDQKAFNAARGTYAYMSPEQCREKEIDSRSDLFTLGVVLYELTTLKPLFKDQSSEFMTFKAITEGIIPPPTNTLSDFPKELEEVIFKALEVDKEKRYKTSDEFSSDLRKVTEKYSYLTGKSFLVEQISKLLPDFSADSLLYDTEQQPEVTEEKEEHSIENVPASSATEEVIEPPATAEKDSNKIQDSAREQSLESIAAELAPTGNTPLPESEKSSNALPSQSEDSEDDLETEMLTYRRRKRVWLLGASTAYILLVIAIALIYLSKTAWIDPPVGSGVYSPSRGVFHIKTTPPGATVIVNLKKQDALTPTILDDLSLNKTITVEVVLSGYQSVKKSFTPTSRTPVDAMIVELDEK